VNVAGDGSGRVGSIGSSNSSCPGQAAAAAAAPYAADEMGHRIGNGIRTVSGIDIGIEIGNGTRIRIRIRQYVTNLVHRFLH